jgi:hypothetical protein
MQSRSPAYPAGLCQTSRLDDRPQPLTRQGQADVLPRPTRA